VDARTTKTIQEVLGTLLYYTRAIDCTILVAIGTIATQQASATKATMRIITDLLNYCLTHPNAVILYTKSDMVLYVESDASYLLESKARSRYACYHYLSSTEPPPPQPGQPPHPAPRLNGPINVPCKIMREILSSASKAELAGLFYNGKEAAPVRITLEELGHPQPPTSIVTDNSTATGIANDTIRQKRSKSMDMRYYWVRDRVRQGHYQVTWRPGDTNLTDYFTKHHPAKHHHRMRPRYLHEPHATTANYYECLDDEALQTVQQPFTNKMRSPSGEGVLIPYATRARQPTRLARGPARRTSFPATQTE
jgi:hypothetical protein